MMTAIPIPHRSQGQVGINRLGQGGAPSLGFRTCFEEDDGDLSALLRTSIGGGKHHQQNQQGEGESPNGRGNPKPKHHSK